MATEASLRLRRKSVNEPAVEEAVKYVRTKGIGLIVRTPWNKKGKRRAIEGGVGVVY